MYVYGGVGYKMEVYNDLWVFSINAKQWKRIKVANNDWGTYCHSMCVVYDELSI